MTEAFKATEVLNYYIIFLSIYPYIQQRFYYTNSRLRCNTSIRLLAFFLYFSFICGNNSLCILYCDFVGLRLDCLGYNINDIIILIEWYWVETSQSLNASFNAFSRPSWRTMSVKINVNAQLVVQFLAAGWYCSLVLNNSVHHGDRGIN